MRQSDWHTLNQVFSFWSRTDQWAYTYMRRAYVVFKRKLQIWYVLNNQHPGHVRFTCPYSLVCSIWAGVEPFKRDLNDQKRQIARNDISITSNIFDLDSLIEVRSQTAIKIDQDEQKWQDAGPLTAAYVNV